MRVHKKYITLSEYKMNKKEIVKLLIDKGLFWFYKLFSVVLLYKRSWTIAHDFVYILYLLFYQPNYYFINPLKIEITYFAISQSCASVPLPTPILPAIFPFVNNG